jgi:hypothetical protein
MVRKATSLLNNSKTENPDNQEHNDAPKPESPQSSPHNSKLSASQKRIRKISKKNPPRKRLAKKPKGQIAEDSENQFDESMTPKAEAAEEELLCETHMDQRVEFLCKNRSCLRELCSFCILEHKDHINEIFPIRDLIKENLQYFSDTQLEEMQNTVLYSQSKSLKDFESLAERLKSLLHEKINAFKEQLIREDNAICESLTGVVNFRQHFNNFLTTQDSARARDGHSNFNGEAVTLLKECIRSKEKSLTNGYSIEDEIIAEEFSKILNNNISFMVGTQSYNSTNKNVPKVLHWFEWEKRELHLFDVINYSYRSIKLIIPFKIPPFSRSIVVPDGKIYLIGGEDPEIGAKKEVYTFNLATMDTDHSLHPKCPMPFKKYDFTLCYHKGFVYVICGKDSDSQVVDSCEKYDINRNQWSLIAPINKRRYAASAVIAKEINKIYLFGGRSDYHNMMMDDIEEYDISKNIWKIIKLKAPHEWTPVEVCSTIQIGPGRILVLGGSDASIEDSKHSYVFHTEDYMLEKTSSLKKAHVFVSAPFMHGNHVFAVGNEYYVKSRNIHRFNISKLEWEIVF